MSDDSNGSLTVSELRIRLEAEGVKAKCFDPKDDNCKHLSSLQLAGAWDTGVVSKLLPKLAQPELLHELGLSETQISAQQLQVLQQHLPGIKMLVCFECQLPEDGFEVIGGWKQLTQLHLRRSTSVTPQALLRISSPTLEVLDLLGCGLFEQSLIGSVLQRCPNLKKIHHDGPAIDSASDPEAATRPRNVLVLVKS